MTKFVFILTALLSQCKTEPPGNSPATIQFLSKVVAMNSSSQIGMDTVTLGGGCFWCIEAVFQRIEGVQSVVSGYSGGSESNPTYEQVCSGTTGHAEVVQVTYDPAVISFSEILRVFFTAHDPTQLNRQGADIGTQYRSVIFYHSESQRQTAEEIVAQLNSENVFGKPVVTQLAPIQRFYTAENYHQDYFANNPRQPYCQMVIRPKIEKIEKVFKDRLRK